MEPTTTSFIPKKAIVEESRSSTPVVGLITALIVLSFLVTVLTAVGTFLWEKQAQANLVSLKENLEKQKSRFQPELISTFKRMDDKLTVSAALLNNHTSVSKFILYLRSITYKDVRFIGMSYQMEEEGVKVSLTASARGYSVIALQSDMFKKNKYIKDFSISGLALEKGGTISFKVDMMLDPSFVTFDGLVQAVQ